jgi:hypothetical protein
MTFRRAVGPALAEGGSDGLGVAAESFSEGCQHAGLGFRQLSIGAQNRL